MGDKPEDLGQRTEAFALQIIKLSQKLTNGREAKFWGINSYELERQLPQTIARPVGHVPELNLSRS